MQFTLGPVRIDLDGHAAYAPSGVQSLTPIETALLRRLQEAAGEPVARDALLRDVWNYASGVKTRTLTVTVHRLRTKVEVNPSRPVHLLTLRGQGVVLQGATTWLREGAGPSTSLVGREEAMAAVRARWTTGLLTVTGPVGVGKTAFASALCPDDALWVDCDGAQSDEAVLTRIASHAPTRLPPTLEALADWLGPEPRPVVLDGLGRGLLEGVELLSRATPVLVTSRGPRGLATEMVQRLEPLPYASVVELLRREVERQGFAVDGPVLERVAATLDGLPLEVVVLAPLLGLFGEDAVAGIQASLEPLLGAAVAGLDPSSREALQKLAVFEEAFDLRAAAAITNLTLTVAGSLLQLLHHRGLLTRGPRSFRLLRSLRRLLQAGVTEESEVALRAWCCGLAGSSLVDGGVLVERHVKDLVAVSGTATSADADALSLCLYAAGMLQVSHTEVLPTLDRLAALHPRAQFRAAAVGLLARRAPDSATLEALLHEARSGDLEAAVIGVLAANAHPSPEPFETWWELVRSAERVPSVSARYLPGLHWYTSQIPRFVLSWRSCSPAASARAGRMLAASCCTH